MSTPACYDELYGLELDLEDEWLSRGAAAKVDAIVALLRHRAFQPKRIVELGAGTGAVIRECQRRGLGQEFIALDWSGEALRRLQRNMSGVRVLEADIADAAQVLPGRTDLLVMSHVVEHLQRPELVLRQLAASVEFEAAIIEVPLENLPLAAVRASLRPRDRNKAGHLHFFTKRSFERLVVSSGLRIVDHVTYVPILSRDTIQFLAQKDGLSRRAGLRKTATSRWLPAASRPVWQRLCYAHHAVLCAPNER